MGRKDHRSSTDSITHFTKKDYSTDPVQSPIREKFPVEVVQHSSLSTPPNTDMFVSRQTPDTYLGSIQKLRDKTWNYKSESTSMHFNTVTKTSWLCTV